MVRIFYKDGRMVRREDDLRALGQVKNLLWVDLQSPTMEEEEWVESQCEISFQTPQEIVEIESSSRFFEQNDTINANSNFLRIDKDGYETYPVSFLLHRGVLFTFRRGDSQTFADTVKKMKVSPHTFQSGVDFMLMLLETRIEADADSLEAISKDISTISKSLTHEQKARQEVLIRISGLQEITMMLRETSIDKQRVLSGVLRSLNFPENRKEHLRIILKDINSLLEYTTFNFERLEYLQNTFMGLINLEQSQVIKIFTVVTIIFMPPTLIAGIFGMNYHNLPTSQSPYGFAASLLMMVGSSLTVLWYFRRKRWI
ncbi:magnesium/cobalt transporter CorA [Dyadobacter tibetensis]|uniref:magnesium/cobalt transporter CorA n=1 Tax=Dyadobacter tibetensis TaxID=1211851 RepID=UPI000472BED5|nr:magnesium/cobalt transporter CorA [Dyadobacter tibetensis]